MKIKLVLSITALLLLAGCTITQEVEKAELTDDANICIIENILGEKHFPREGRPLRAYLQKHLHGYSPALVRILLGMVSLDPRKRPTA